MNRRTVAAVMACLLCAGAAAQQSQPASEPAGAAKYDALVRETYAQRLAAVKASATDQDDVELARDLLTSAFAEDTPPPLRAALARKALELTRPVGTTAAVRLAEQALGLLDATEPLPPLARSQVRLDIALQALNRGRVDRLPAAQLQALARKASIAYIDYLRQAVRDAEEMPKAEPVLAAAGRMVQTYAFGDLAEELADIRKEFTRVRVRETKFRAAEAQLKRAEDLGEKSAIRAARRALGQVYLDYDGDLLAAAGYLEGTEHPHEQTVRAAAAFLRNPADLKKDAALGVITDLASLAGAMTEEPARRRVAECADQMIRAFEASKPAEADRVKLNLVAHQVRKILGTTEADQFRRKLIEAYGGLACKLQVLDDGRARATYDFSTHEQIKDWLASESAWEVKQGVLVCRGGAARPMFRGNTSRAANKLRWRADKPFKIAFSASAARMLSAVLLLSGPNVDPQRRECLLEMSIGGAYMMVPGNEWSDRNARLVEGKVFRFEISGNGKGSISWKVNDVALKDLPAGPREAQGFAGAEMWLVLRTRRSDNPPGAFDDVSIEAEFVLPQAPAADNPQPAQGQ